jgi:hypothetical protein
MKTHSPLAFLTLIAGIIVLGLGLTWLYTAVALRLAQAGGVYATAEEGMRSRIARGYIEPEKSQIIYAGTNSFDGSSPHVWYVIACVWGGHRADGTPTGSARHAYDQPGFFFLHTKDGWVFISEGAFPGFIGYWMKVFGMAGPGSAQPSHDWGSAPQGQCTF